MFLAYPSLFEYILFQCKMATDTARDTSVLMNSFWCHNDNNDIIVNRWNVYQIAAYPTVVYPFKWNTVFGDNI